MADLAEEIAIVSFIDDDYAYLKADSASACSSCSAKSSCGAKTITKPNAEYNLRVRNDLNLKEGDSVVVSLESQKLLIATVILYILPLLMLFAFSFLGKSFYGEIGSIIGGITGLAAGLLIVRQGFAKDKLKKQFEPAILRNLNS